MGLLGRDSVFAEDDLGALERQAAQSVEDARAVGRTSTSYSSLSRWEL